MKPVEVLLVEDSLADVRLAEEALVDIGLNANLHVVNDGDQAVEYLTRRGEYEHARVPDVVLLDLNMPRMNGHEVLCCLRKVPHLSEIPVIVLTATDRLEDIERAHQFGMNYYMRKPIDARQLEPLMEVVQRLWH